ncbi:hypothetical protein D3C72_2528200 [compost metagenome]
MSRKPRADRLHEALGEQVDLGKHDNLFLLRQSFVVVFKIAHVGAFRMHYALLGFPFIFMGAPA